MEAIREIGIFIVIAQAVLYFVPGESYVKYVKVIIGIIMIAKMAQPVLNLVNDGEWERIIEQTPDFESVTDFDESSFKTEDGDEKVREQVEKELVSQLNEKPFEGYTVSEVSIAPGEGKEIIITVSEEKEEAVREIKIEKISLEKETFETKQAEGYEENAAEEMKAYYGEMLGMEPDSLKVKIN